MYGTIAAAIVGEVETVTADTTQAGTTIGVIVGSAALNPADDFYNDDWVLLTDATPGDGLVCRYARVRDYIGATRTLIIDQPWNFGVGETFEIIRPIRLWLNNDITEAVVTMTKNCELNLEGHRLQGGIDQTVGSFFWIRGAGGYITNGVQKTNLGALVVEDLTLSTRGATIYALLMTSGSNLGRCDLKNCTFRGVVAMRRGRFGGSLYSCKSFGVDDGFGGIPYRWVESVAGVSVVVTQFDFAGDSEGSGNFFHSENSITGPAAYISIQANWRSAKDFYQNPFPSRRMSVFWATGVATLTITMTFASEINIDVANVFRTEFDVSSLENVDLPVMASVVTGHNFTGTLTVAASIAKVRMSASGAVFLAALSNEGTVDMTGTITLAAPGSVILHAHTSCHVTVMLLAERISTGTAVCSANVTMEGTGFGHHFIFYESQNVGAPTVTISGTVDYVGELDVLVTQVLNFAGITVSVGTWTISGTTRIIGGRLSTVVALIHSGGTWTLSGSWNINSDLNDPSTTTFALAQKSGGGGTATMSGAVFVSGVGSLGGGSFGNVVASLGGTMTVSGTVEFQNCRFAGVSAFTLVSSFGVATAVLSGAFILTHSRISCPTTFVLTSAAGSLATGPANVRLDHTDLFGATLLTSGPGVITWAGSVWRVRNCYFDLVFPVAGARMASFEAFTSFFSAGFLSGAASSILLTGANPTVYRLWKCGFFGLVGGQPDILDDWVTVPSDGVSTTANQLRNINAAGQSITPVVGTQVEGVQLLATALALDNTILVRRGKMFVQAAAATAAGANGIMDAANTNQIITAASVVSQRVCRTLEAVGATVPGLCYSVINLA